ASINTNNSIKYIPDTDYFGSDSLIYGIEDTDGDTAISNVNITVECITNCQVKVIVSWDKVDITDESGYHVVGYKIYYGSQSNSYSNSVSVGNVATFEISGLSLGEYFFAVTSFNEVGSESAYSAEVSVSI
ncbi:MAG: hypothetical protein OEY78_09740, partial [Gammaproteobacteria bacterium]|nr:hypothetical protein [Gammaproteobacteria bacterium]